MTIDNQIVYWVTKFLGHPVKEKVSGSDFFTAKYDFHKNNPGIRIFLRGGRAGVAQLAARNVNAKVSRENITGAHSPAMNFTTNAVECKEAVGMLNNSGANVLVAGLDAPKQDFWISKYHAWISGIHTFMAPDATLDFAAGSVSRAPRRMRRCGLEWLYRLAKESGRMWQRYLVRDLPLFYLQIKQRPGSYIPPFSNNQQPM